jgi:hypothetical protein
MTPAELLRSHLSTEDNAVVDDATCAAALARAVAGRSPRTRVEVAAAMVHRGPSCTRLPALAARPLQLPRVRRLLAAPLPAAAAARPVTVLPAGRAPVRRVLSRLSHAA